jgi:UDP-glucose 4-epimerase
MKKTILVTGGAGYIGSHTVVELLNKDYEVILLDNFSNSKMEILGRISQISPKKQLKVYKRDCCKDISDVFSENNIDGIIHFAALKAVGESCEIPLQYYNNNILSLTNILNMAEKFGVENFVFSSSCSLYGNLQQLPAKEDSPMSEPESPYAYTKLVGERIIKDFSIVSNLKSICLRYFNPVGAHISGLIGESPINKPNNIIPVILNSTETGEEITVFGGDYDTKDGTCIRDYVHVSDIANAHVLAIEHLFNSQNKFDVYNLGYGNGVSVLEVIKAFESENNIKLNYKIGDRRIGDVVEIYSDSSKAINELGWKTNHNLSDMVKSAWNWHNNKI